MTEILKLAEPQKAIDYLRQLSTVREHCFQIRKVFEQGHSKYFYYHPEKWSEICEYVSRLTLHNYPDLEIPLHSRWRHFDVGELARVKELDIKIASSDSDEKARVKCELVIISVLLDAGAGNKWKFYERETKDFYSRSEGLALASFRLYCEGFFSNDSTMRVDAASLASMDEEQIAEAMQVSEKNPLLGLEGRASLLKELGQEILAQKEIFPQGRLGEFFDYLKKQSDSSSITTEKILQAVLTVFQNIWPSVLQIENTKLGDVSRHSVVKGSFGTDTLVPFHKLSQWLTYSLIEPLQEYSIEVKNIDSLTGLAEYRNGGLFLDGGLLSLKNPSFYEIEHNPQGEFITEWRAITLSLLDELAILVRKQLKKPELTLGQILQGGTWLAGRDLAYKKREDGSPPLRIKSSGTLF